ncbi:MAG TPA: RagB/SusD family nutrient uptake outer membrane protein [Chitinophaga sp.]|uniref:RagB/SusD family nutrient uptake outer membrane protein n=1 Tax=Chitinophaga sp. TaxID=1869181 RepID=UPI002DBA8332|nr:RagB/SusD family nutrient uptake outer membrane protein [Chitinophaga sp.]HEU4553253.1 RagB/SusD family nutrient uptake outer membrane protein [Chitinophaga sp.]
MKLAYIVSITAAAILISASGCEKFVDTPIPTNSIVPDQVFTNDATAVSALLGAYQSILNTAGDMALNTDLFGDDVYNPNASGAYQEAQENTYSENTNFHFFDNYYRAIFLANSLLEGLETHHTISAATAQQIKGESRFLRAYCHFVLANLYGNPPLVTTTLVSVSAYIGNTPREQLYAAIINDLKDAYELIGTGYPSEDRARANKATVSALLAKVYLYTQQWQNAEAEATRQITNPAYSMADDLNTVFVKDSPETIWQLWSQYSYNTQGATYVPSDPTRVTYILRPGLLNAFEAGDQRKVAWTREGEGNSAGLFYAYKYKQSNSSNNTNIEYLVQFRLAEQYLVRAEARAHLNNISGAMEDVNAVRARAGLANVTAAGMQEALLKIEQERRIELMTENGNRWFDLNRTGRATYWLQPQKPTWQPRDTVLPYATTLLLANPNLEQNKGY